MLRRATITAAVAAVGLFALPAAASATDFCVPSTAFAECPAAATAQADLQAAITAATAAPDGSGDAVHIAPGSTYTDTDLLLVEPSSDDLAIIGHGSTVTSSSTGAGGSVLSVGRTAGDGSVLIDDITVTLPATFPDSSSSGLSISSDATAGSTTLEDVAVHSESAFPSTGIALLSGRVNIDRGEVGTLPGDDLDSAIVSYGFGGAGVDDVNDISDVELHANYGFIAGNGVEANITRSDITAPSTGSYGIDASGGAEVEVTNSVIASGGSGFRASAVGTPDGPTTVTGNGVTLVAVGTPSFQAVSAFTGNGATENSVVSLESSIVHGWASGSGVLRQSLDAVAQANISITHSNAPTNGTSSGPGSITTTGTTFSDPLFTDEPAGDYTLQAGSPSVDMGNPASTLTEDRDGRGRPQDGNGTGPVAVDQGAYERPQTPPDTVVSSGPADGSSQSSGSATFEFAGDPLAGTERVQCRLDDDPYGDCTSPLNLTGLDDGSHTVLFRAEDEFGNQDATPASRTFTVDTVAPDTSIVSGPANGSTIETGSAQFGFQGTTGDTATLECKLDSQAFAACTSPNTFAGLSAGSHTVSFRAIDAAGNIDSTPATRSFTVADADTAPPDTTIDSGPGQKAKKGKPRFTFSSNESGPTFECSLVKKGKAAKFEACTSPQSYKLKRKKKTTKYAFSVRATDAAGNTDATPATAGFKVKKKPKKK